MDLNLPAKVLLTRGDIMASNAGISRRDFRKAIASGVLQQHVLPGCRYAKYLRADVVRVFGLHDLERNQI